MSHSSAHHPLLQALVGDEEVGAFFSDEAQLAGILKFESALAKAQAEAGLIAAAAADAIAASCASFSPDWDDLRKGLVNDGVVVPALVRQLRSRLARDHREAFHKGATSQDAVDTAFVLALKRAFDVLRQRLDHLIHALSDLEARDGAATLMAHTRMQVALPFTAGDKISTWRSPLVRERDALARLLPQLLVLQLGGPIGTREGLDDKDDRVSGLVARRLGLGDAAPWHAERDRMAAAGAWLSIVTGSLGKIGQDVALLVQNEVGAVNIAGGGGSSAMPHKSNPVGAEVLVALARFNAGMLGTLHQAMVHENERSGAAWTLEWMVLPQMMTVAAASLRTANNLIANLSFTAGGEGR